MGSLPAGLAEGPLLYNAFLIATPADCAGNQHSIIAVISSELCAQLTSSGPPLNSNRITGAPAAGKG